MSTTSIRRQLFQPRLEVLEDRTLLSVGVFVEDFSNDADLSQPGLDTAADGFQFAHQFDTSEWTLVSETGRGHVLDLGPRNSDFLDFGGRTANEIIFSVTLDVFVASGAPLSVFFEGPRASGGWGNLSVDVAPGSWQTITVTRAQLGSSVSTIQSVEVYHPTSHVFLDNLTVDVQQVFVEDFSDDADPTQAGFDTAADGFLFNHAITGRSALEGTSNPVLGLFSQGLASDRITFSGPASNMVESASVSVHGFCVV